MGTCVLWCVCACVHTHAYVCAHWAPCVPVKVRGWYYVSSYHTSHLCFETHLTWNSPLPRPAAQVFCICLPCWDYSICHSLWLSWRCWSCKPMLSGLHRKPFTNWTTSQPQHPHFKILISSKLRGNSGIKDWNWSHTSKKTEHDSQGHILLLWKTIAFYKTNNKVKFYVRTVRLGKDRIHSSCTLSLHYKKKLQRSLLTHLHMRDRCARRTQI